MTAHREVPMAIDIRWSSRVGEGISASDSAVAHSARERATLGITSMSEWIPERDSSGANHDSPRRHMSLIITDSNRAHALGQVDARSG